MSETETQAADVIDLRADEQLDATRLETYLKGKLAGSDGALRIRQFGGGHANLTYLLQYGEGEKRVEYVLRRPPHGKPRPLWPRRFLEGARPVLEGAA